MASFSERLRELRQKKSVSQQELADYLNVNKQTISGYERGVRRPSGEHAIEIYEALADYFNVDLDYLLGSSDVTTSIVPHVDYSFSLSDNEKIIIEKYRKSDSRTRRMLHYFLGLENMMKGDNNDEV